MPDLYSDAAPAPPGAAAAHKEPDDSADTPTAQIPKAVLGGKEFKPGEEVVLKVVQVMEDSVLVAYASEEPGEEPAAEPEIPSGEPETRGGGGMASVME